jgi:hypothetical protein
MLAVVWCVVAMVVVTVAGPKHLSRKHTKQEEPSRSQRSLRYTSSAQAEPQAHKGVAHWEEPTTSTPGPLCTNSEV